MHHLEGPLPSGYERYNQFKQYHSSNLFVSSLPGDNCVCIDDSTCVTKNIISNSRKNFLLLKFSVKKSFSTYPFDLQLINMNNVVELADKLCIAELKCIQHKCILLPHQTKHDYFVAMPLLHNS